MAVISVGQPTLARSSGRVRPAGDRSPRRQSAGVRKGAAAVSPDKKRGKERAPSPPLGGAPLQRGELAQQRALLDRLNDSYLVVQGPPGSGKTYRGARLITHLLAQGRKVGITAQSHKVIHNLLAEIERAASEERLDFKGIKRGDHWDSAHVKTSGSMAAVLDPEVTRW
jgi:hypothetical protein